jgi:integrase/recombinase XerC
MLIESFIAYIREEKRYASNTIQSYHTDLLQFEVYMRGTFEAELVEATYHQVRNYIVALMEDNLSANSVGRKLSTLRSFYKHLVRTDVIEVNPMSLVKAPKAVKRLPVFVDDQKLDVLLDSGLYFDDSFPSVRDKMIIETFFGAGIRLAELIALKEVDLDIYDSSLKVLGKGNKERIIPVSKQLVNQLKAYLELKSLQNFNNKSDVMFVTDKGADVYPMLIQRIVARYLSHVSTQEKKSPHVLRHSYATALLNRGADLNAIKELLGHASLAATQVYTHNTIERLKLIYKQAHPKA